MYDILYHWIDIYGYVMYYVLLGFCIILLDIKQTLWATYWTVVLSNDFTVIGCCIMACMSCKHMYMGLVVIYWFVPPMRNVRLCFLCLKDVDAIIIEQKRKYKLSNPSNDYVFLCAIALHSAQSSGNTPKPASPTFALKN